MKKMLIVSASIFQSYLLFFVIHIYRFTYLLIGLILTLLRLSFTYRYHNMHFIIYYPYIIILSQCVSYSQPYYYLFRLFGNPSFTYLFVFWFFVFISVFSYLLVSNLWFFTYLLTIFFTYILFLFVKATSSFLCSLYMLLFFSVFCWAANISFCS